MRKSAADQTIVFIICIKRDLKHIMSFKIFCNHSNSRIASAKIKIFQKIISAIAYEFQISCIKSEIFIPLNACYRWPIVLTLYYRYFCCWCWFLFKCISCCNITNVINCMPSRHGVLRGLLVGGAEHKKQKQVLCNYIAKNKTVGLNYKKKYV